MKQFFFGALLILLSALIAGIFTSLGWFIPAAFVIIILGLIPLFKTDNFAVGFGTLLIVGAVGMVICSVQEYSLFQWPGSSATSTLSDKKIAIEYEGSAPIIHQFWKAGWEYAGTAYVSPVVSSDWKKDQPVEIWTITGSKASRSTTSLRLVGLSRYDYLDAIANAEKKYGLTSIENVPIVRRVDDPTRTYHEMLLNGLLITGSGILALLLLHGGILLYDKIKK